MRDITIPIDTLPASAETFVNPSIPLTGEEYLESLRDGREVWIYGERVKDVTTHPAFRNSYGRYLDRFVRGSNNYSAEERVKLMKMLWDAVGSEFGSRHELYEVNYSGNHEVFIFFRRAKPVARERLSRNGLLFPARARP